jgi:VWFA-related protein
VFKGGKFVDNLTIDDFEVYEDGVSQKVEAIYLIKKTNIEREEIKMQKEEAKKVFAPETSRNFFLLFELHEYFPKIKNALEYFFNNVFSPGDTLKVVTPIETYDFNIKAFEMFTNEEIAKDLAGKLRKDSLLSSVEYRRLLLDYEDIQKAVGEEIEMKKMMYKYALRRFRNLRYIEEKRLLDFADFLKKVEGQKNVFLFYQKLVVPLLKEDLEDFEAYIPFDADKINQAFSDSSISTHFIYLTKTSAFSTDGISVTSRGLLDSGERISDPLTQDISGSIFSAFKDIAQATGGTVDSSANAASSFKKAVNASENYYLLYYNPKSYKADGKFKKITVRVKGKKYKVTHRAGYIAD